MSVIEPDAQKLTKQIKEQTEYTAQLERRLQETEALYQTSLEINQLHSLQTVLETIVRRAVQLLHTQMGGFFLMDADSDKLKLVVGHNLSGDIEGKSLRLGEGLAGTIAQTGHPLIIENYQTSINKIPLAANKIGRILGVPLLKNNVVIGVLNVFDAEPGSFSQAQMALLQKFAQQATIAIENSRQLEEERNERLMAEVLREVSLILSATLNSKTILDKLLYQINRVVPFDVGSVILVKAGQGQAERVHSTVALDTEIVNSLKNIVHNIEQTPNLQYMAQTEQSLIIPDVYNYPGWVTDEHYQTNYIRSWLGAPIIIKGRLIGFLTLDKQEPDFYQPEHADRLSIFAGHAAIALENAQLFEHMQHTLIRTKSLYEAGQWLTSDSLTDILQNTADNIADVLPANRVALITLDTHRKQITQCIKSGPGSDNIVDISYEELWDGLSGYVLREQIPTLSSKFYPDPREADDIRTRRIETRCGSIIVAPLIYQDEILGTITAINAPEEPDFTGTDVELLLAIANQTTIAIENIRLFQESRQQAKQLKTLHQLSRDLTILRDKDILLHEIVNQAIQLLQADAGGICLFRPSYNHLEWVITIGERIAHVKGTLKEGEGVSGTIWATRQPIIIQDYLTWEKRADLYGQLAGAVVGVPIQWGNRFLGALVVLDDPQREFTNNDAALLNQFAAQAAIAIENTRLHQEARTQAQQVQQILDTVQDGIILLDSERRVKVINPAAQEYLTVLSDTPPNAPLTFLGNQSITTILSPLNNQQWLELTSQKGPERIFEGGARPLTTHPADDGWVMLLREVTETRKSQKQIRQQERLAAVGQLAAGIAHDFNNILTSIIGYTELIRAEPDISSASRNDLGRVVQQSQRAAHLIRQILDFSRQSMSQKQTMDLVPFLKETVKLLERTIPENIAINLNITTKQRYPVNADPVQLQQALTNLAVNARDAMPRGGKLNLSLNTLELLPNQPPPMPNMEAGQWASLSIADTGTGIAPDLLPHLFEPFFTTKEVGQGTGLGLAQVYGIIKQHNSFIDVNTRPQRGTGTTFTIFIPMMPDQFASVQSTENSELMTGNNEVILLVEDDETVRQVTKTMLIHLGYQVLTAVNGQAALKLYQQLPRHINLVLTDLTMPKMDGLTLAKALRTQKATVKIIVLTGYPLNGKIRELRAQGITDWLQKPVKLDQLAKVIHQALN
jgi:GAF domain-containing protein/CheY-like chemotaxis protein